MRSFVHIVFLIGILNTFNEPFFSYTKKISMKSSPPSIEVVKDTTSSTGQPRIDSVPLSQESQGELTIDEVIPLNGPQIATYWEIHQDSMRVVEFYQAMLTQQLNQKEAEVFTLRLKSGLDLQTAQSRIADLDKQIAILKNKLQTVSQTISMNQFSTIVDEARMIHWAALLKAADEQGISRLEILKQTGFPVSGGAELKREADRLSSQSSGAGVKSSEEEDDVTLLIENQPDMRAIDRLNHTDVVQLGNGTIAVSGHFDKPNYLGWHVVINWKLGQTWQRYEPPIPAAIVNNFDPAIGGMKIGEKEYLVLVWCERSQDYDISNAKFVIIDPETNQPYQGMGPSPFYVGDPNLSEFVDYTEAEVIGDTVDGAFFANFVLFGPNGADAVLYMLDNQGNFQRIGEYVNPSGGVQFTRTIAYDPVTKEVEVAYLDWGAKEVKVTKMDVITQARGNTFTVMKFEPNEFVFDIYDELPFRHASIPEVIKLHNGWYATVVIVNRAGLDGKFQPQVRVDISDSQGGNILALYLDQAPGTYRLMPGIVEFLEQVVEVDGQWMIIPNGVMVLFNEGIIPEDMAEKAVLIGQSEQGWQEPLIIVSGRTTDMNNAINFQAFYVGDRQRAQKSNNDGALRFSYDHLDIGSVGQETHLRAVIFDNFFYLPIILN
jgi:hypothetical protein